MKILKMFQVKIKAVRVIIKNLQSKYYALNIVIFISMPVPIKIKWICVRHM